jgi:Archaeal/vacuolar-type H+-ATPase subunit I
MKMVTLIGPKDQVETAVEKCVINHEFHLENAQSVIKLNYLRDFEYDGLKVQKGRLKGPKPFELKNLYADLLAKTKNLSVKMGITLEYRDFNNCGFTYEDTKAYVDDLFETLESLEDEHRKLLLDARDNEQALSQLKHIHDVEQSISSMTNMKHVKFRFGRIPKDVYDVAYDTIAERRDMFFLETSVEKDYVYGLCFILPSAEERADAFFSSLNFERIWLSSRVNGTADEASDYLTGTNTALRTKAEAVSKKIMEVINREKENLLLRYSYIRFMDETLELVKFAAHSDEIFYLIGWVPQNSFNKFKQEAESIKDFYCLPSDAEDVQYFTPPIKRKMSFLSRIYTPFLEMYGLPSYNEVDPGFFLAITYTIMFGIMYGDVGQGLCLFALGLILYKLKGAWLWRIISCVGVSSTFFGFVYGSVFGIETLIPGFKVLEGDNMMRILIAAVAFGVFLLILCMGINIINGIKQKDIGKIFFSPNGVAGAIVYISTIAAAVCSVALDINLLTPFYVISLIILPLVIIFFKEPLTKLCKGEKNWLPESVGSFIVEGFFEMFETVLSYVSNTISFLRLGAFAISHAGMMMVVFMLSKTASGHNIVGVIFGNIFVMGLEGVLVCIQVLRLEFYEMFGRFYEDSGRAFEPKYINYSEV